jgi:RNA polymerase sigma factor (sigma-70 family)
VVNAALAALRRPRPLVHEIPVAFGRPDDSTRTADRLALFDAIETLAPRQRAAVILRYYHDYDYTTIARILGTTQTNVGAMLSRALDRLRIELDRAAPAAAGARR